ncbi:MAG: hypothetical protein J6W22_06305 [Fibrobacter sp.]|nr:hypothetical protein [Fibrobacter sp.]
MKKLNFVMLFLLVGCYHEPHILYNNEPYLNGRRNVFVSEETTLNIYWEWGEVQTKMRSLHFRKDWNINAEDLKLNVEGLPDGNVKNPVCIGSDGKAGERIYLDSINQTFNAECLYFLESRTHYLHDGLNDFEFLFGDFLKRPNTFAVKRDSLKLLYYGDSLLVTGNGIRHSKLDPHDKSALEKKVKKKMGCTDTCDGSVYEISFPLNEPVFSLTVRTDPKDLKGYKPLKLDPSILPLESPGYKKLREYEESLGKRF